MTALIEKIKSDQLQARKDRNPVATAVLTTLIGEVSKVGPDGNREVTDAKVVKTLKSFIGNIDLSLVGDPGEGIKPLPETEVDTRTRLQTERDLLVAYVPPQLTEAELRAAIAGVAPGETLTMRDTGRIKGLLEDLHPGAVDGKMLSMVLKG
jgi:uncharacterized protein YqeY